MIKPKTQATHKLHGVSIHKASAEDAPAIAALAQELAAFEQTHSLCNEHRIATLLSSAQTPQCELLVAKQEGIVIAFALYYVGYDLSSDTYGFHLADICVAESKRRQGVGHLLMKHIAQHAIASDHHWISLTVLDQNPSARGFYRSLGLSDVPVSFMAAGRKTLSSICQSVGCVVDQN